MELRRKNLRLFIGLILFAILLALLIIAWKLSMYHTA